MEEKIMDEREKSRLDVGKKNRAVLEASSSIGGLDLH